MNQLELPKDLIKILSTVKDDDVVDIVGLPGLDFLKSVFPIDFFKDVKLTKAQLVSLCKDIGVSVTTNRTLPIICTGVKCAIRNSCPFDKLGIAPVGKECALELVSMQTWRAQYLQTLEVDVNDKVQMDLIDELVEIEIFNKYRFPAILNTNIDGFQETIHRYSDKTGALVEARNEVSKAFLAKMAMNKRKEAILKELLATPKQKVQYKKGKKTDAASMLADVSAAASVMLSNIGVEDIEPENDE